MVSVLIVCLFGGIYYMHLCVYTCINFLSSFFIEHLFRPVYKKRMKNRKPFTTSLKVELLKEIKKLAIDLDRSVNNLLEEGIIHLLKKYGKDEDR